MLKILLLHLELDFTPLERSEGLAKFSEGLAKFSEGLAKFSEGLAKFSEGLAKFSEGLAKFSDGLATMSFIRMVFDRGFHTILDIVQGTHFC